MKICEKNKPKIAADILHDTEESTINTTIYFFLSFFSFCVIGTTYICIYIVTEFKDYLPFFLLFHKSFCTSKDVYTVSNPKQPYYRLKISP